MVAVALNKNLLKYSCLIFILALFIFFALSFLPQQSLWIDETTQLSGLTLNPVEVTKWLSGKEYKFNVPPDRMPPLSYWVGWVWKSFFGLTETSMRLLGLVCIFFAIAAVFFTGYKAFGLSSGIVAASIFGLSPNIVAFSVEIRAYPLFIFFSSCALYYFVRIISATEDISCSRAYWKLVFFLVLAACTHFFGFVLAISVFGSLFIISPRTKLNREVIMIGIVPVIMSLACLLPFIFASASISGGEQYFLTDIIRSIAKLVIRLFAHSTTLGNIIVLSVTVLGAAILVLLSLPGRKESNIISNGIFFVLLIGIGLTAASRFLITQFISTGIHYNSWLYPWVAVLFSSTLMHKKQAVKNLALIGILCILLGNIYGSTQLATKGTYFAHGPHSQIVRLIDQYSPQDIAIVLDGPSGDFGFIFFPLRYTYKGKIRQYEPVDSGLEVRNVFDHAEIIKDPTTIKSKYVFVVISKQQRSEEIWRMIHGGDASRIFMSTGILRRFKDSRNWEHITTERYISFVFAEVNVFQRKNLRHG